MTRFLQLIVLTIGLFIVSCGERIDDKAKELIDEIDSADLRTLHHLHFMDRGSNGYWQNDSIQRSRYALQLSREDNTLELVILEPKRFINDFSINLVNISTLSDPGFH